MDTANPLVPSGVARWRLKPAGSFAVTDLLSGRDVTPRGRKARAIIAYLSTQPDTRISREKLMDLLWGDRSEAQARASLRQALLEIRHAADDLLQADRDEVWIDAGLTCIDRDADPSDELFENLNHITPEFDEWLCGERERSRNDAVAALGQEAEKLLDDGRGADALSLIEQMERIDPYNEDVLQLAMRAEFQAGHTARIEQRFRDTADLLNKDLGVAPSGETLALRDRLLGELRRVPEPDSHQDSAIAAASTPISAIPHSDPAPIIQPVVGRRFIMAGGAAAVAAAAAGGWFALRPGSAAASSIAVLPFANLSGDPSQAYFSDGLAEELRRALSRIPALKVVARTSSEKVRNDDVKTAARKLRVGTIVTGSVRRSPTTIRVNAQLIDGKSGLERWSETYDRPAGDILHIQTDIAQNVATALSIRLSPSTRATLIAGGTSNPTAFDLVLQVERDNDSDSLAGIERRLALVNAALSLDPNYAEAFSRKAALLMVKASVYERSAEASQRGLAQALAVANRAIAIAPGMARGYTVRAHIYRNLLQIRPAWADDRRAVDLPGESADVLDGYMYSLCTIGRARDAVPLGPRLVSLDPLGPLRYATQAFVQYCARQYDAAVRSARRSLELAPNSDRTRGYLGYALLGQGKPVEAEAELRKLDPTYYRRLVGEAVIAARAGQRSAALEKLRALQDLYADAAHYQYGEIYSELGLADEAFKELEQAWEVRDPGLASLRVDPFLDPIRADPRLALLERKLDFP